VREERALDEERVFSVERSVRRCERCEWSDGLLQLEDGSVVRGRCCERTDGSERRGLRDEAGGKRRKDEEKRGMMQRERVRKGKRRRKVVEEEERTDKEPPGRSGSWRRKRRRKETEERLRKDKWKAVLGRVEVRKGWK